MRHFLPVVVVVASLVLGATVFRGEVASAAMQALQVFVTNDSSSPVPVHEQGTANVNVTGGTVNLGSTPIASKYHNALVAGGAGASSSICVASMLASTVVLTARVGAASFAFFSGGTCSSGTYTPGTFLTLVDVAANATTSIALYDRMLIEGVQVTCFATCEASYAIIGR